MPAMPTPLQSLRQELAPSSTAPATIAFRFAANANSNASRNTYITPFTEESLQRAEQLPHLFPHAKSRPALYGIPVSIKDCFDVARHRHHLRLALLRATQSRRRKELLDRPTPSRRRRHHHRQDPPPPARLRHHRRKRRVRRLPPTPRPHPAHRRLLQRRSCQRAGRLRPRSHRHRHRRLRSRPLRALRPRRLSAPPTRITRRRSTSGPAAYHLAQSFDTIGLLFRDLRDAPALASAIFDVAPVAPAATVRIGCIGDDFLHRLRLQRCRRIQRMEATARATRRNARNLRSRLLGRQPRHLLPHRRQRSRSHPSRTLRPLRTRHRRTPHLRSLDTSSRNRGTAGAPSAISHSDVRAL